MAATTTTWHDRTTLNPKSWLLANGEVVTEPPLEETSSGRKVRVKGTTTSMFSRDVDDLIYKGVEHIATTKGTKVWMSLDEKARQDQEDMFYEGSLRSGNKPDLHMLKQRSYYDAKQTVVWFRFRHDTLPIEATLVVHVGDTGRYRQQQEHQNVGLSLVMQSTLSLDAQFPVVVEVNDTNMTGLTNRMRSHDHRLKFTEFLRDDKPEWLTDLTLRTEVLQGDRAALKVFRDLVSQVDGYETIQVPDLRDLDEPAWLDLTLHETNLTGEFQQSMLDYLDGGSIAGKVKEHWGEIVKLLRSGGIVVDDVEESDLARALGGGEAVKIAVHTNPQEPGHQLDYNHSLTVHLPTGTIVVNCSNTTVNNNEVAHKWEEALTMASLTGQEDELLAYARRFKETEGERKVKQVLKERK